MDVSSLGKLACDLRSVEGIRRVISATFKPPIREFRFSSCYSEGFQGVYIHLLLLDAYAHHYRSVHNIGAAGVVFRMFDYRTLGTQYGTRVLERRTQGLSQAPPT